MIISELLVRLTAETSGFAQKMSAAEKQTQQFGRNLQSAGRGLSAGLTVPLVAIGGAALAAANQIDAAMDSIRSGTGATGDALARLGDDLTAVLRNVPASSEAAATAIADLNTRTGRTGESLQELTTQVLNLSRVAGSDLSATIAGATRAFGDWDIATENQAASLDHIWKVSQATGISVDNLLGKVVQFGAPLRQFGFQFEEAAVIMGKWEREGVNTELVLGSLRIALGNFAREGVPMRQGLNDTIQKIQELGAGAEATALAMDTFGARAGADMAAAILEGRFAFEELLATMEASNETINKTAADTMSFGESWQLLKNNVLLALAPLGGPMIESLQNLTPLLVSVLGTVQKFATAFANLPTGVQYAILAFGGLVAAIGPLLIAVGSFITLWPSITIALAALTGPVGIAIAAVTALTAVWVIWGDDIKRIVASTIEAIQTQFDRLTAIFRRAREGVDTVTGAFRNMWDRVVGRSYVPDMMDAIEAEFARLDEIMVRPALAAVGIVNDGFARLKMPTLTPVAALGGGGGAAAASSGLISGILGSLTSAFSGIGSMITGMLSNAFGPVAVAFKFLQGIMEVLGPAFDALMEPVVEMGRLLGMVIVPIFEALSPIVQALARAFSYVIEGIGTLIRGIGNLLNKLPGSIGNPLVKFGQNMIDQSKASRRAATATDDLTKSLQNASTNIPPIFDLLLRRRQAGMIPGGGGGGSGSNFLDRITGGLVVNIYNPPANMNTDEAVRQVTDGLVKAQRQGGVTPFNLIGAVVG